MGECENIYMIQEIFREESSKHDLKGLFGVTTFQSVYSELLPIQQRVLDELCGDDFRDLFYRGSFVSIAYAYPEYAIDAIATMINGSYDKEAWNTYAHEYHRLNNALNITIAGLAGETKGIAIPATVPGIIDEIKNVEEYYDLTISHRVIAEKAGIGWRGKNELVVNPQYSCAIRISSLITGFSLEPTGPSQGNCGDCRACLDACPFLRFKDRLGNYREQCWRYMKHLDLDGEVCGKCIKACYRNSIYADRFKL